MGVSRTSSGNVQGLEIGVDAGTCTRLLQQMVENNKSKQGAPNEVPKTTLQRSTSLNSTSQRLEREEALADLARVLVEGAPRLLGGGGEAGALPPSREAEVITSLSAHRFTQRCGVNQAPHIRAPPSSPQTPSSSGLLAMRERLERAEPLVVSRGDGVAELPWEALCAVLESEQLESPAEEPEVATVSTRGDLVEVNSGGKVFFALFKRGGGAEGVACLKFGANRLNTLSEYLAYEVAEQLSVTSPGVRLMHRESAAQSGWCRLRAAAEALEENCSPSPAAGNGCAGAAAAGGPGELRAWMKSTPCLLLLEYVHGRSLQDHLSRPPRPALAGPSPRAPPDEAQLQAITETLGRVMVLDLVLCNNDRLKLEELGWRGNPGNLRWAEGAGRVVAIDHTLPRRPPTMAACSDEACARLACQLAGPEGEREAARLLREALGWEADATQMQGRAAGFLRGFRGAVAGIAALERGLRGVFEDLRGLLGGFFVALEMGEAGLAEGGTLKLRQAQKQARLDAAFWERLHAAERKMQEDLGAVQARLEEWCREQGLKVPLTTGFLAGPQAIVQAYELKVRLQHMLDRMEVLAGASEGVPPVPVTPGLSIGGVLCAGSLATLLNSGITHIVNCAGSEIDNYFPERFQYMTVDVQDVPEAAEELRGSFARCGEFVAEALAAGGRVLVHCFEGKSRSSTLILSYMVAHQRATLKDALAALKAAHPPANPNAGFMAALLALDTEVHGQPSMAAAKSKKPVAKECSVCGKQVGISQKALDAHMERFHKDG